MEVPLLISPKFAVIEPASSAPTVVILDWFIPISISLLGSSKVTVMGSTPTIDLNSSVVPVSPL